MKILPRTKYHKGFKFKILTDFERKNNVGGNYTFNREYMIIYDKLIDDDIKTPEIDGFVKYTFNLIFQYLDEPERTGSIDEDDLDKAIKRGQIIKI